MNNSKLVNILRTFSNSEMKEFEKAISSPFFNRGRNYMPLFKELKKFYPKFENEKLTLEYLYSRMYPQKKYNRQIIWNMSSGLLKILEEYLIYAALKKDKFTRANLVIEQFNERKLSNYLPKTLDEFESILDNTGIDENYFYHKVQLEVGRKAYYFLEDKQHLLSEHIVRKGEYAFLFFLKNIAGVISDMNANSGMFNARFETDLPNQFFKNFQPEKLIRYCKEKKYRYSWLIEMYYCLIKMLEPNSERYFFKLKVLFEKYYDKFTIEEINNWLTVLCNFCISKADNKFRKILFEIHKFELKKVKPYIGKYLPKILFIQILRNALAINEITWTKSFIEEFVPKLKPSFQKPMRALGLAFLYLKVKDYEKVLHNLANVRFIDARDKLNVKSIYIRTYYDLNETEALLSQIDSTLHFVSNNSAIPQLTADSYRISLKLLRRLITAKENDLDFEIEFIRKTANENKALVYSEWLINKIDELKNKKER